MAVFLSNKQTVFFSLSFLDCPTSRNSREVVLLRPRTRQHAGRRPVRSLARQALAVIFTRFPASSRGRTIRGRARSSAPSLLPRNAVLLFQRRLRFAVHRAPVLPELRGRALVFLQGAREDGRDRPPQEEERQALRDPAGVHHARPRVSLVPRVRGSGGSPVSRLAKSHERRLFSLQTTEDRKLATTAAKRLYTWDTPS